MARALARGWGEPVLCSDAGSGRAQALVDELGGDGAASNVEVAEQADLVVLCHKPDQLDAVAAEIAPHARAVASVLGGTTLADLREAYPAASRVSADAQHAGRGAPRGRRATRRVRGRRRRARA